MISEPWMDFYKKQLTLSHVSLRDIPVLAFQKMVKQRKGNSHWEKLKLISHFYFFKLFLGQFEGLGTEGITPAEIALLLT